MPCNIGVFHTAVVCRAPIILLNISKMYGTLEQNKLGNVAAICAHKKKRTSPETFSLLDKAH